MIDPADIAALKARHDIVEVVGRTLELRRSGRDFWANCPFHNENTPSFNVSPSRQTFCCYGCGERGDVLDFILKTRGCTFVEAVEILGGVSPAGAPMPARPRIAPPPPKRVDPTPFWNRCTPPAADDTYLTGRGIDPAAVARHDLARYTPERGAYPEWWPRSWSSCWRLVTRAWLPDGAPASLHGRAVVPPPDDGPKTRWAFDVSSSGVVFWNRRSPADSPFVVIAEGMTDWLALAAWGTPKGIAVYGATMGGFSAFRHIEVPAGVPIVSTTDEDPTGDGFMGDILAAYPRHTVARMRPSRFFQAASEAA